MKRGTSFLIMILLALTPLCNAEKQKAPKGIQPHSMDSETRIGALEFGASPAYLKQNGVGLTRLQNSETTGISVWRLKDLSSLPIPAQDVQLIFTRDMLYRVTLYTEDVQQARELEALCRKLQNPEASDKSLVFAFSYQAGGFGKPAQFAISAQALHILYGVQGTPISADNPADTIRLMESLHRQQQGRP